MIVREIFILEPAEEVMNAVQNNEVSDVGNVAKVYQVYMMQIIFTPYNAKLNLISRWKIFSKRTVSADFQVNMPKYLWELCFYGKLDPLEYRWN